MCTSSHVPRSWGEAPPRANEGVGHGSTQNRLKLGELLNQRPLSPSGGLAGGGSHEPRGTRRKRRGLWQSCLNTGQRDTCPRQRRGLCPAGTCGFRLSRSGRGCQPPGMPVLLTASCRLGVHEAPTLSLPTGSRRSPRPPSSPKPQPQAGPVTSASASCHRQEGRWPSGPTLGTSVERTSMSRG